jgi:hypothetical protein
LFGDIFRTFYDDLIDFDKNLSEVIKSFENVAQIGYENYVQWENLGGKDLQHGANKLTNRQLFWVAYARRYYNKYHEEILPEDFVPQQIVRQKYFHVWMKANSGFQEAFNCHMTKDEEILYNKFQKEFNTMSNSNS